MNSAVANRGITTSLVYLLIKLLIYIKIIYLFEVYMLFKLSIVLVPKSAEIIIITFTYKRFTDIAKVTAYKVNSHIIIKDTILAFKGIPL